MKTKNKKNKKKNTLWGGRFKAGLDKDVLRFSSSINVDYKLAEFDLTYSLAHVTMLAKCKIISASQAKVIKQGLKGLLKLVKAGKYKTNPDSEDIHTDIQNKLRVKIGPAADKLNTARSRNDQVSLSTRMYSKDKLMNISKSLTKLQQALIKLARANDWVVMPGFTHLQHAQPVLWSHYLLAFVEMFQRDKERLADAFKRVDVMPAGSGALAGTSLPIDRDMLAKELGFAKISANSIDAVSDRDFVIEIISSLSVIAMHLSRMSEDFIIMSTAEFGFIDIDQAFCTGSSLMPQKKNPDVLELIRGGSSRVYGDLISILVTMKALPLSYNRDMQWDKEGLFKSLDFIEEVLLLMTRLVKGIKVDNFSLNQALADEFLMATDLAEYLVKKGVAFRQAHKIVGELIMFCSGADKDITELSLKELKSFSVYFDKNILKMIDPQVSVKNKISYGSTGPLQVKKQLKKWAGKLQGVKKYA